MNALLTCREFIEFLDDYLSGDLAPQKRAELDRHLAICPDCVDYLRTYESTVQIARRALLDDNRGPPDDAPEDLIRAILAARANQMRTP